MPIKYALYSHFLNQIIKIKIFHCYILLGLVIASQKEVECYVIVFSIKDPINNLLRKNTTRHVDYLVRQNYSIIQKNGKLQGNMNLVMHCKIVYESISEKLEKKFLKQKADDITLEMITSVFKKLNFDVDLLSGVKDQETLIELAIIYVSSDERLKVKKNLTEMIDLNENFNPEIFSNDFKFNKRIKLNILGYEVLKCDLENIESVIVEKNTKIDKLTSFNQFILHVNRIQHFTIFNLIIKIIESESYNFLEVLDYLLNFAESAKNSFAKRTDCNVLAIENFLNVAALLKDLQERINPLYVYILGSEATEALSTNLKDFFEKTCNTLVSFSVYQHEIIFSDANELGRQVLMKKLHEQKKKLVLPFNVDKIKEKISKHRRCQPKYTVNGFLLKNILTCQNSLEETEKKSIDFRKEKNLENFSNQNNWQTINIYVIYVNAPFF